MITAHHLYIALKSANVSDETAAAAAEEVAEFMRIREDIAAIKGDMRSLQGDVNSFKWMFGLTWTILVVMLGGIVQLLLRHP